MQSRNPVFARSETFNGRRGSGGANPYGHPTYPGSGPHAGYGDGGLPGRSQGSTSELDQRPMTIDGVVQRTAMTLGLLVAAAAVTWLLIGDAATNVGLQRANGLALAGALVGFGLGMVNSFKRVTSPALVLAYAVVEGVFVGALSKALDTAYHGVVPGAVLGTVAAFAGTLAAYKVFDIKVGDKFRRGVMAAMLGFVALSMLDLVMGFFGASFGFNGFGTIGLLSSAFGLVLGVLMLVLDFDYVDRAIAAGASDRESWRAAFGLTVTLVWIYIELLRLLAIFQRR